MLNDKYIDTAGELNICPAINDITIRSDIEYKYNPEKFTFHLTLHIDKDYDKILELLFKTCIISSTLVASSIPINIVSLIIIFLSFTISILLFLKDI